MVILGIWDTQVNYIIDSKIIRLVESTHQNKLTTSHHNPDNDHGEDIRFRVLLNYLTHKKGTW